MNIPKIEGSRFWNPYEGVKAGASLVKLMRGWIESDALIVPGRSKEEACGFLSAIEREVRATLPKIKASEQEWAKIRFGKQAVAHTIFLTEQECKWLQELRKRVEELKVTIARSNGALKLFDLAITFPKAEIAFTTETYFDFVLRSLDEILESVQAGKLIGPAEDQSW